MPSAVRLRRPRRPGQRGAAVVSLGLGNAGANTAADHITIIKAALKQLPGPRTGTRPGGKVYVRDNAPGCIDGVVIWMTWQAPVVMGGLHAAG